MKSLIHHHHHHHQLHKKKRNHKENIPQTSHLKPPKKNNHKKITQQTYLKTKMKQQKKFKTKALNMIFSSTMMKWMTITIQQFQVMKTNQELKLKQK